MDEGSTAPKRKSHRSNVLLAASLEADGAVTAVKLRNLSADGALVEADSLPPEGSRVLFRRNDLCVGGRIAWIAGKHAGVAFANRLEPQDVLRNIPAPKARSTPDFRRPGVLARPLTPEEQSLIRQWA